MEQLVNQSKYIQYSLALFLSSSFSSFGFTQLCVTTTSCHPPSSQSKHGVCSALSLDKTNHHLLSQLCFYYLLLNLHGFMLLWLSKTLHITLVLKDQHQYAFPPCLRHLIINIMLNSFIKNSTAASPPQFWLYQYVIWIKPFLSSSYSKLFSLSLSSLLIFPTNYLFHTFPFLLFLHFLLS